MLLLQILVLSGVCHAQISQIPFSTTRTHSRPEGRAPLHGRFLHITDIHPDEHYIANATISSSCHRREPEDETPRSGYWGAPYSECDSSLRHMNVTFEYLEQHWADEVDFVICECGGAGRVRRVR